MVFATASPVEAQVWEEYTATFDGATSIYNGFVGYPTCDPAKGPRELPNTQVNSTTVTIPIKVYFSTPCVAATGTWTITAPTSPFRLRLKSMGWNQTSGYTWQFDAPFKVQSTASIAYNRVDNGEASYGGASMWVVGLQPATGTGDACRADSGTSDPTKKLSFDCNMYRGEETSDANSDTSGGIVVVGAAKTIRKVLIHVTLLPVSTSSATFRHDVWLRYNLTAAPVAKPVDIRVDHLEAVQVTQVYDDLLPEEPIPMIVGKSATVRIFALVPKAAGDLAGVKFKLFAEDKDGKALPGSPRAAAGAVQAVDAVDRNSPAGSVDVNMPKAWLDQEGEIRLWAEVAAPDGVSDPDLTNNVTAKQTIQRIRALPKDQKFRVGYMRLCVELPDEPRRCPSARVGRFAKLMRSVYPAPDDGIRYGRAAVPNRPWRRPITRENYNDLLTAVRTKLLTSNSLLARTDQFGAWLPGIYGTPGGCSDPRWMSAGRSGRVFWLLDRTQMEQPETAANRTLAHEVGHNLGLRHPLTSTCEGVDSNSTLPDDRVGEPGFDPAAGTVISSNRPDLMSYCNANTTGNSWLGPVNYPKALLISGSARRAGTSGTLAPVHTLPTAPEGLPASENATHCVRMWGDSGLLSEFCFRLTFENWEAGDNGAPPDQFEQESFVFLVAPQPGLKRLTLVRKEAPGMELASLSTGSAPPSVQITDPQPGVLANGSLRIGWTGSDPDGRPLTYLVQYSADGGQTWASLDEGVTDSETNFETSDIDGGDQLYIRVIGSAGLDSGIATAGPFSLTQAPRLEVEPAGTELEFGQALVGGSAKRSLVVRNTGSGKATIGPITIDSTRFEAVALPGEIELSAGEEEEIELAFLPLEEGVQSAEIKIEHNIADQPPFVVRLTGKGVTTGTPQIRVTPAAIDFGSVNAGSNQDATLSVKNIGLSKLSVSAVTLAGARFQFLEEVSGFTLDPGADKSIGIRFTPSAGGAVQGSVTITSDDPSNGSVKVNLTGKGSVPSAPAMGVDRTALDFGSVTVSQRSDKTVTISSTGTETLRVSGLTAAGMFSVVSPAVPFSVSPGASVAVTVRFSPTTTGAQTGTLTITSNDAARESLAVNLTGTGIAVSSTYRLNRFEIGRTFAGNDLAPSTIAPVQQTVPSDQRAFPFGWWYNWPDPASGPNINHTVALVTLTQIPTTVVPGTSVQLGASMTGDWDTTGYGVDRDHTISLAGDAGSGQASNVDSPSAIYHHEFKASNTVTAPQADSAAEVSLNLNASLRFGGDHAGAMTVRAVYSTGAPVVGPAISVNPPSLDFGSLTAGQAADKTLTISNTGGALLQVTGLAATGRFSVLSPGVPFSVPTGASVTVTVRFSPAAAGAQTGTLTIASNDAGRPSFPVNLTGTATAVAITYRLNRFEIKRAFAGNDLAPSTIAPVQQTLPADRRGFPFGWKYNWPDPTTGPNINNTSAVVTLTQIPSTVATGGTAQLAASMSGDWDTTGYGVDRDHTIALAGDAGSGQASNVD
ncbi:MAG: choice-of-anchor D domain-containing protein, partial [Acidobacteria bacterium]|nr:choice-of-anchor D domain-containing protein [Acidobacteriota bacterium]